MNIMNIMNINYINKLLKDNSVYNTIYNEYRHKY